MGPAEDQLALVWIHAPWGAKRGPQKRRNARCNGAMTTPSGDRREKQGITSRKDRCGTKARGVIRCGRYQGSRRPLESVVRPDSFVRHVRRRLRRWRRARRRPGMGRCGGFATERRHCQSFRGFRAGSRRVFDARCRGPFRIWTRTISKRRRQVCMTHAPAGMRWSGQWSESVTGMRSAENQTFSPVYA